MSRFERWSRAKRGLSVDEEPSPDGEGSRHTDVDNAPTQELDEPSVAECATDAPSPIPEPGSLDHTLPDPDRLDAGSDFSAFMSPGVSGALRRKALRRLWSTGDYNVRDGLNDYDQDFKAQLKPMATEMADKVRQWTRKLEDVLEEPDDKPDDRHLSEDTGATQADDNPPSSSSFNPPHDDAESTQDKR